MKKGKRVDLDFSPDAAHEAHAAATAATGAAGAASDVAGAPATTGAVCGSDGSAATEGGAGLVRTGGPLDSGAYVEGCGGVMPAKHLRLQLVKRNKANTEACASAAAGVVDAPATDTADADPSPHPPAMPPPSVKEKVCPILADSHLLLSFRRGFS
ncbi:unnamed protein product [Closterium sp. NIES-54]